MRNSQIHTGPCWHIHSEMMVAGQQQQQQNDLRGREREREERDEKGRAENLMILVGTFLTLRTEGNFMYESEMDFSFFVFTVELFSLSLLAE